MSPYIVLEHTWHCSTEVSIHVIPTPYLSTNDPVTLNSSTLGVATPSISPETEQSSKRLQPLQHEQILLLADLLVGERLVRVTAGELLLCPPTHHTEAHTVHQGRTPTDRRITSTSRTPLFSFREDSTGCIRGVCRVVDHSDISFKTTDPLTAGLT